VTGQPHLRAGRLQDLGDLPAEAAVVGDAGDERILAGEVDADHRGALWPPDART
jgi:hypothetical protein